MDTPYAEKIPAAFTRLYPDIPAPAISQFFTPINGWSEHTAIPVGRDLTNRTVIALKRHGVTAVAIAIGHPDRSADFTIAELTR